MLPSVICRLHGEPCSCKVLLEVKFDRTNRPMDKENSVLNFVSGAIFSIFSPSPLPCLVLGVYEVRECAQLLQLVLVVVGLDNRNVFVAKFVESVLWRAGFKRQPVEAAKTRRARTDVDRYLLSPVTCERVRKGKQESGIL